MVKLSEKWLRIIKTTNLYLCFFNLGMSVAVPGPTLLDMQNLVNTDTQHIAFIYTARSIGYLVGSLLGGVLFDVITPKQVLLTLFNFLSTATILSIPWSRSLGVLTGFMVVNGLSLGCIDTGGNVCCLNLWGKESGPYYQALHFAFGLGGLVAPLIAAPFLGHFDSEINNSSIITDNTTFLFNKSQDILYNSNFITNSSIPTVTYAYTTIGGYALIVSMFFLAVCIISPVDAISQQSEGKQAKKQSLKFTVTLVTLNIILVFVETGTEIGFAQMLTTYAVKGNLKLSATTGSFMTSVFWGSFTVSRFISVFLAIKFTSFTLIVGDLVITGVGSLILLFFAVTNEWALWLSSVLLGVGIASFFPATVGWMEKYIIVTNKIASSLAIGAAFGEMIVPFTISYYIESVPEVLVYIVPTSCVLSTITVMILYLLLRNKKSKYSDPE
ncbi:Sodium-dependent glucose transporter 1, partial [Stegodyphus mimosarum]